MRLGRILKITLSTLSALILASILLPILLSLLLSLPAVQDYATGRLTALLGGKMQTEVKVERLRLRLFNRVELTGVYLEDYHRDTLFFARRIDVPLREFNPFTGKLVLGEVRLEGPKFYLMQDSTGLTNLKQIILRLKRDKPKTKKKPFRLQASGLTITGMDFKHLKRDRIDRPGGVNFTDLDVEDFNLRVHHVQVINDSLHLDIDSLRLREKSGLVIHKLSVGHLALSGSVMDFQQLRLDTPDSQLGMEHFRMEYGSRWQALKNFIEEVNLRGHIVDSRVSFRTIAYFAPTLRSWQTVFEHVTGEVEGTVADLRGRLERVRTRETELAVNFGLHGIPDIAKTRFVLDIDHLNTSEADIAFILHDITGRQLDEGTAELLRRLGPIGLSGHFDGLLTRFEADALLHSAPGTLELRGDITPQPSGRSGFFGHLHTEDFDAGDLLQVDKLGRVSLHADLNGFYGGEGILLKSTASVPALEFNGYTYRDVKVSGDFENRKFIGQISSPDPNMDFEFNGQLDFNDSIPRYDFELALHNADLNKLGFNRRDSVSRLTTNLTAHASGTHADNLNGQAVISGLSYVNHLDTVQTGEIRLLAENSERRKLLSLHSSFADVEFRGKLGYAHMLDYFKNTLLTYLPSISPRERKVVVGEPEPGEATAASGARVDDYYLLTMDIKEANNVAGIFLPGLRMASGTKLSFLFNPRSDVFNLSLSSDFIERNDFFVSKLTLGSRNQGDSISLSLQSEDLFAGGLYMPNFSVLGGARENSVNLASRFSNPETGLYARVSTTSRLSVDPESGIPQVRIHFNPSDITSGGQTWRVFAREIRYDSTRVEVNRFTIDNGSQHLLLHGIASRSDGDTLKLDLRNFDLSALSQLTSSKGYRVRGYTNGMAEMTSALKGGQLAADIRIDSMQVNQVALPQMRFTTNWDFQQRRARFQLAKVAEGDTLLYGYFRPNDRRFLARADLRGMDLSLLDPVLSGVIRGTRGTARAQLQLSNPGGKNLIEGTIRIDSLATVVDFTNVPYTVQPAEIQVEGNRMHLRGGTIRDGAGNSGGLDLNFDFNHLTNLKYDVRVRPENLQVLGTTMRENNLFYGTIYASGAAEIRGDKHNLKMNIQATTAGNSHFFMPLSSDATISRADFITFRSTGRERRDDSVQVSRRKLLMLEQQRRAARRRGTSARMDIGIALNVLPNTEVQLVIDPTSGDVLRGRGSGNLSLGVTPANNEFTIRGDYRLTEGNMQFTLRNIISRNFTLQPGGTIQFTGDPLDAVLDATARYSLKASLAPLLATSSALSGSRNTTAVDCLIHLTGRLTDPDFAFDVQVPNASPEIQSLVSHAINSQEAMATQFLWLLATKNFYAEGGIDQNLNVGASGATATGIDFLTNQLSSLMTTDRFSFVPKYTPGNDYNPNEIGGAISAELIKDKLIFEADMSYSTENNKKSPNSFENTPFSGDATLSLLLDPGGNFRMRAFTRTIDRFAENQGMQETGLGFTYREDFDNLKDLRRIFRERKEDNRKRREERREARRQEAQGLPEAAAEDEE